MTNTDRATRIVELAEATGVADNLDEILYWVSNMGELTTDLHRLIRDSFSSDDDFDDLMHEIDHLYGDCTEGDDDCAWNDED